MQKFTFNFVNSLAKSFKFSTFAFLVLACIPTAFSQPAVSTAPVGVNVQAIQQDINWISIPGGLSDIGVGANGVVWGVNSAQQIYRWTGSTWTQMPGAATRVSVDPQGNAWVVNAAGGIYAWNGSDWAQIPGGLSDIGVGANGVVWGVNSAQQIYRRTGSAWTQMPGAATRVSVDPQGNAWVVNAGGQIYQWVNNNWLQRPGAAKDIAACHDGNIFVVGTDNAPYKWNGSNWDKKSGANLMNIACDAKGMVYATTASQGIVFGMTHATATATATAPAPSPISWVATSGGNIPATAVAAGREANGQAVFLCRAKYGPVNDVHPGKTRREFNGCNIGWGGKEVAVAQYEVAVSIPAGATWQPTTGANIPATAIIGGQEAAGVLAICRANHQGGVHIGKTRAAFNGCNIGWGGREVAIPQYEVLVMASQAVAPAPATATVATAPVTAPQSNPSLQGASQAAKNASDLARNAAVKLANAHIAAAAKQADIQYSEKQIQIAKSEVAKVNGRAAKVGAQQPLRWVKGANTGLAFAGNESNGSQLALCRAGYNGGVFPGKVVNKACNIGVNGAEIAVADYESAVGTLGWQTAANGQSTPNAVIAGKNISKFQWSSLPGAAVDVGAGGDGVAWVINSAEMIYRWNGSNWSQMPGAAKRVAVDGQGNAWVVNAGGQIYQWVNNNWVQRPGALSDIGAGANGVVWGVNSAQQIYRWNGSNWTQMPGAAVRVSVDPDGNAWVVNSAGNIYQWLNNNWIQRPGFAKDVAACGNKDIYVAGTDNNPYKWNGSSWDKMPGGNLLNIACDTKGKLFATLTGQEIAVAGYGSLNPKSDELPVCRALYSGGVHPGKLYAANCVITYAGKEILIPSYQVAVDLGLTAPKLNQYMRNASVNAENKALAVHNRVLNEANAAKNAALIASKEYKDAIARAAIAQTAAGMTPATQVPAGEINYVAMVGGSSNLGRGVTAAGGASVNYGVNGQVTPTGVSGQYTFVAQAGGAVTYGDADYNTTISGLAKYEQSYSGCAGVVDNTACLMASANNTASLSGSVQSNVALGGGTTLTSGATGTLSTGYYGKAGFEAGPRGAAGGAEGHIGYQAKAEANYSIVNDGYGGAGAKAGVSAGGLGGGGFGSATLTDGNLKVEACGEVEFLVGVDLCINGQVNVGGVYEAVSPTVMQGANFLIEEAPGVYRTSSTAVQGAGVVVYKTGDKVVNILANGTVGTSNQVANSSVAVANNIATGTMRAVYSVGGVTAGAANKLVKDGQIAAEVVASDLSRVAVIQDIAKSGANTVVAGMTGVGNTVVSGVTNFGNQVANVGATFGNNFVSGASSAVNTVASGASSAVNTVASGASSAVNAVASVFSGW